MREKGAHTKWKWRPFKLKDGESHALPKNAPHDGRFTEHTEFIVAFDPPHVVSWV